MPDQTIIVQPQVTQVQVTVSASGAGIPAPSNYALWLLIEGNAGKTPEEYQESLKGPAGPSNYAVWLTIEGNEGKSFEEYQATLKGLPGNDAVAPVHTFHGEDFFKLGNKLYRRNLTFGSVAEPLTGALPELFSGLNPGAPALLFYSGASSPMDAPYAPELGSPAFDPEKINLYRLTWISADLILYRIIAQLSIAGENILLWSNKFDEYLTWGQIGVVTRSQEVDESWTLEIPAAGAITQTISCEAESDYTFSVDLKLVPADARIVIYSNPGWNDTEFTNIAAELSPGEFTRISKTVTTAAGTNQLYITLQSATGGTVNLRHSQVNTGSIAKPYIETTS